jgi:hypothetical protein
MQQGQQAKPMLWVWIDNEGQNCEDSANAENLGGCQSTGDASLGIEQWK